MLGTWQIVAIRYSVQEQVLDLGSHNEMGGRVFPLLRIFSPGTMPSWWFRKERMGVEEEEELLAKLRQ